MLNHNVSTGRGTTPMLQLSAFAIIVFALPFSIMNTAAAEQEDTAIAQQRPTVTLVGCQPWALGCKADFCVKVRTEAWDRFPPDTADSPEVYIQFSRKIRGQDDNPLPSWRSKVVLDTGINHDRTLWFRTDHGPLLLSFVDFAARLQYVEPSEDPNFDIMPAPDSKATWRMQGDTCEFYTVQTLFPFLFQ